MSMYTTGEIAKICNVTVRTVQYYDSREILVPKTLSEGGRRLYSEDDLKQLKIICFLRSLDMPINSIKEILSEEHSENIITLMLEQQEAMLKTEIELNEKKLALIDALKKGMKLTSNFSIESIGDIASIMENKKKLFKVHSIMLTLGVIMDIIEFGTLILGIVKGIWWPLIAGIPIIVALGTWISLYYFRNTAYICPECHTTFKPKFREAFFAPHNPASRKLSCPNCNHKGYCVETYGKEAVK